MDKNSENKNIQIFISTRNRLETLIKTFDSVLNQTLIGFQIIISDNSTNDETENKFSQLTSDQIVYIRRRSNLGVIEHFNTILDEVTSEYFMIFHDDDIMLPEMVAELYTILNKNENIVAVGSNALLSINGRLTTKLFQYSSKIDLTLTSASEVAIHYLVNGGIVPFPSYLYRNKIVSKLRLNPEHGRESCDATFIMDVTAVGQIYWLVKPLMIYSFHQNQVSSGNLFYGRQKLVQYIIAKTKLKRTDKLVKRFRLRCIYCELKDRVVNNQISIYSSRYLKLMQLLLKYSFLEYFSKAVIITLITRFRFVEKGFYYAIDTLKLKYTQFPRQ